MKGLIIFILFVSLVSLAIAHEDSTSGEYKTTFDLSNPLFYIIVSGVWLVILVVLSTIFYGTLTNTQKRIFFYLMVLPVMAASLYLAGHTIYGNAISETHGPVHWHADYQVWACGERLDLINPKFPSNKIGTPLFHEHNDDRIHLEGTVDYWGDITLGKFFEVIGGDLHTGELSYPTQDRGVIDYANGESCPDGGSGNVKVYINGARLENYQNYLIYPNSRIPPGDCMIIEFSPGNAETTDKICESWQAAGWTYDNYKRPKVTIGDKTWEGKE